MDVDVRADFAQLGNKLWNDPGKFIVERADLQVSRGRTWVELLSPLQSLRNKPDNPANLGFQFARQSGWLQPVSASQKQGVPIKITQSLQSMTDRWLSQPHFARNSRGLPMAHGTEKNQEDGGVDQPEINLIYISH
ncbi:hypothetical protein GCM10011517_27210 [Actibacterium pelagium]|uniref:Uncharacterized protein n=1 Tax=Actibacterium pelagium TaxID=2029103 RepID=A0A917ELN1_9RHOB|nr:hypothetical protein GCM10011517_27210 [Actibacterium pelagium]